MTTEDKTFSFRQLLAAVNQSCSCGGRGPDDKEACPACEVWHRLMGRAIKRETEIAYNAGRFVNRFKIDDGK